MNIIVLILFYSLSLHNNTSKFEHNPNVGSCGYGFAVDDSNSPNSFRITGIFRASTDMHGKRSNDGGWVYRIFPSFNSALVDRNRYLTTFKNRNNKFEQIEKFEDSCN